MTRKIEEGLTSHIEKAAIIRIREIKTSSPEVGQILEDLTDAAEMTIETIAQPGIINIMSNGPLVVSETTPTRRKGEDLPITFRVDQG